MAFVIYGRRFVYVGRNIYILLEAKIPVIVRLKYVSKILKEYFNNLLNSPSSGLLMS